MFEFRNISRIASIPNSDTHVSSFFFLFFFGVRKIRWMKVCIFVPNSNRIRLILFVWIWPVKPHIGWKMRNEKWKETEERHHQLRNWLINRLSLAFCSYFYFIWHVFGILVVVGCSIFPLFLSLFAFFRPQAYAPFNDNIDYWFYRSKNVLKIIIYSIRTKTAIQRTIYVSLRLYIQGIATEREREKRRKMILMCFWVIYWNESKQSGVTFNHYYQYSMFVIMFVIRKWPD